MRGPAVRRGNDQSSNIDQNNYLVIPVSVTEHLKFERVGTK